MIVRRRGTLALAALGALALAAACKDAGGPDGRRVTGTYALRSINGSLPFVVGGGFGFQTRIVGGRIKVVDGRTVEDVFYAQHMSTNGSVLEEMVDSALYPFRISNDTMFIERPMPFPPDSYRDTARVFGSDSITLWRRLAKINGFRPLTRGYVAYARQ